MSRKHLALVIALFTVAFGAFTGSAAATRGVDLTSGGAFTGNTTSNQTLSARVGILTLTISCSQSIRYSLTARLYSGVLAAFGSLTGVTFTCGSGSTARVLNLPINLTGTATNFSATTGLISILGVQVEVATPVGTCLFRGDIGLRVTNGSTTASLTGGTLAYVSGPCTSAGTVSAAPYALSAAPVWRLLV
jgi:hypothetical protein